MRKEVGTVKLALMEKALKHIGGKVFVASNEERVGIHDNAMAWIASRREARSGMPGSEKFLVTYYGLLLREDCGDVLQCAN